MSKQTVRVIHYGLGPIGLETARLVAGKNNLKIVGAVDIAPELVGKDLGRILNLGYDLGVGVTDRAKELFDSVEADVVIHTAGSRISTIFAQLSDIVDAGLNVVSSAEELLFPAEENKPLARDIDRLAKDKGVTILGTGVNPGFVMDALPLRLTGVCQDVANVKVVRVVDAGTRRYPLQKKVGAGLNVEEFRKRVSAKQLGHVGLVESLLFIAHYLGFALDRLEETIDPMIAEGPLTTDYFDLKAGDVAGIKHIVRGFKGDAVLVDLDLRMYIGASDPHDAIHITGIPNVSLRIDGGVAGDQATAAILVNSTPDVMMAAPGLQTVKELPMPHFFK